MFISNLLIVVKQVVILYLIVAVGFFADKAGKFTDKTAKLVNNLLFYIITPCVIINAFSTVDKKQVKISYLLISFACCLIYYVIGISFSRLLFKWTKRENRAIYRHAMVYANCGFVALPLAEAILGAEGVFYCSVGVVVFNILVFTHGVWQMNEGSSSKVELSVKHILVNPGTIGIAIGLPMFFLQEYFSIPQLVSEPIRLIGSMNTPLAMLCLGTYLSHTDLKTAFTDPNNYLVALFKLIVVPGLLLGCLYLGRGFIPKTLAVAAVISACPASANNTAMFAAQYGKDVGHASKCIMNTTVIGIVTIPAIIALAQIIF